MPAPPPPPPPRLPEADAEEKLLALAREVAAIGAHAATPQDALRAAIDHLVAAWRPDAPLPAALFAAWSATRDDERGALSLAFAREQIALGVHEIIETAAKAGALRDDLPAEALAWLITAACESIAHGGDAAERTRWLLAVCAPRDARR
jgi:hypothetical protein